MNASCILSPVCDRLIITPVALIYHIFIRLSKIIMNVCLVYKQEVSEFSKGVGGSRGRKSKNILLIA